MRIASIVVSVCLAGAIPSLAADDEASVIALEQQCEAAREAQLKPLRDAEIARCKTEKRSDPAYCERYWRDYGNAHRAANGTMQPRMFDDIPECTAAREARGRYKNGQ